MADPVSSKAYFIARLRLLVDLYASDPSNEYLPFSGWIDDFNDMIMLAQRLSDAKTVQKNADWVTREAERLIDLGKPVEK